MKTQAEAESPKIKLKTKYSLNRTTIFSASEFSQTAVRMDLKFL